MNGAQSATHIRSITVPIPYVCDCSASSALRQDGSAALRVRRPRSKRQALKSSGSLRAWSKAATVLLRSTDGGTMTLAEQFREAVRSIEAADRSRGISARQPVLALLIFVAMILCSSILGR